MNLNYTMMTKPNTRMVDVSQSIGRSPTRDDDTFHSFTTNALPYVLKQKRVLSGRELLMIHGFPSTTLHQRKLAAAGIRDSLLRDLASNSWASGVVLAVLAGILRNVPHDIMVATTEETKDDVNMEAFVSDLLHM